MFVHTEPRKPRYVHLTSTLAVYLVFSFAVFGAETAE
jgi:hypothetical protein